MKTKSLILFVLINLLTITGALANGYCDSRPTRQAREACYRVQVPMPTGPATQTDIVTTQLMAVKRRIDANQAITPAKRAEIYKMADTELKRINAECKTTDCQVKAGRALVARLIRENESVK